MSAETEFCSTGVAAYGGKETWPGGDLAISSGWITIKSWAVTQFSEYAQQHDTNELILAFHQVESVRRTGWLVGWGVHLQLRTGGLIGLSGPRVPRVFERTWAQHNTMLRSRSPWDTLRLASTDHGPIIDARAIRDHPDSDP